MIFQAMFKRITNFFPNGSAPGFAQYQHVMIIELVQSVGQQRDLCGFAAAFRAFKRDEQAFAHNFFSLIPLGVSSMTQPLAFNSSRIASDFLKSRDFLASARAFANSRISMGISVSIFTP